MCNSRIDPADHHEALDNVASAKGLSGLSTVDLVGEGCQAGDTDEEEDKGDGHGDEVREDAKRPVSPQGEETDNEEDYDQRVKGCCKGTMGLLVTAVVHTLATSRIRIRSLYALVWTGGYPSEL